MTFTAIICSSCYALAFPHPLLSCWREFLLFGGQPPTPVHVSCLLSPPHLPSVVVWVSTWLAMYNESITDETQHSFSGILRLLYTVAWTHHGPKSSFTYLGLIITGAPSPGYAPAGYPPWTCSGQGPRKGREQARRAPSSPPERAPPRHCVNTVQEVSCPSSAAAGSGPVSEPPLPLLPRCSLSSPGSSVLSASLGPSPCLITATILL